MVNILRRWNQPIMVVITVLVIVSFVYWGPNIGRQDHPGQTGPKLYGQTIRMEDWKRQGNRVVIFGELNGFYIKVLDPLFDRRGRPDINGEMVARSVVFDRECEALGITSTAAERKEMLDLLPNLRGPDGEFDGRFLEKFARRLGGHGFTESDFDSIFLDGEVRAKKLSDLIGGTTTMVPAEIRELAARSEMKVDASYVSFKREDLRKEMKATDEELKKFYDENKGSYMTSETRKVRFAAFRLVDPGDKPLLTKDRTAALEKLARSAFDLAQALKQKGANFDDLAKQFGATVEETKDFFPATDSPAEFKKSPAVAALAFKLTKEQPFSPHISIDSGSFVLELKEIKAPEQRPFEDAKKDVETTILGGKAKDAALARAKEMQPKLAEALKAGKKFPEAAQALNLTVEEFPTFTKRREPQHQYRATIYPATLKLTPGQISEALADPRSGDAMIVHLDARTAADDAAIEDFSPELVGHYLDDISEDNYGQVNRIGTRIILLRTWLGEREIAAGMGTAFARALPE